MAKKQWETVMLSKETKERLKDLKGQQSYELFISGLLANQQGESTNIDTDLLIREYLEPIKSYMKENTPSEKLLQQTKELVEEYNQMEEQLELAYKKIKTLEQNIDRLRKKR